VHHFGALSEVVKAISLKNIRSLKIEYKQEEYSK